VIVVRSPLTSIILPLIAWGYAWMEPAHAVHIMRRTVMIASKKGRPTPARCWHTS